MLKTNGPANEARASSFLVPSGNVHDAYRLCCPLYSYQYLLPPGRQKTLSFRSLMPLADDRAQPGSAAEDLSALELLRVPERPVGAFGFSPPRSLDLVRKAGRRSARLAAITALARNGGA